MSLIPLSGLLKVAAGGVQGYGEDKADALKQALQAIQEKRAADKAALDQAIGQKNLRQVRPGDLGYGDYQAGVDRARIAPKVEEASALIAPHAAGAAADANAVIAPHVQQATQIATAEVPIKATEAENAAVAAERHAAPIPIANKDGSQTLVRRADAINQQKGQTAGQGALAAPMAAKVGQFGEMLKKAHDLTALTDNLDVSVGESATRDLAEHGLHIPLVGTVPGTKGIGNAMMSHSPEYSQYQAALAPFILAAAHALSGARINQDQVEQIRKSIELAPGDFANKAVRAQKEKNMIDLINSIGGSLPKDAIGEQEGQMDEASLAALSGRGYRRIGGQTATDGSTAPALGSREAAVAHLKAQGKSDAEILKTLGPP